MESVKKRLAPNTLARLSTDARFSSECSETLRRWPMSFLSVARYTVGNWEMTVEYRVQRSEEADSRAERDS